VEKRKVVFERNLLISTEPTTKKTSEIWTLWLTLGNFDPVTFEVDPSITVHEMKKLITEEEEFELQGM
jgi:hypothetical protein